MPLISSSVIFLPMNRPPFPFCATGGCVWFLGLLNRAVSVSSSRAVNVNRDLNCSFAPALFASLRKLVRLSLSTSLSTSFWSSFLTPSSSFVSSSKPNRSSSWIDVAGSSCLEVADNRATILSTSFLLSFFVANFCDAPTSSLYVSLHLSGALLSLDANICSSIGDKYLGWYDFGSFSAPGNLALLLGLFLLNVRLGRVIDSLTLIELKEQASLSWSVVFSPPSSNNSVSCTVSISIRGFAVGRSFAILLNRRHSTLTFLHVSSQLYIAKETLVNNIEKNRLSVCELCIAMNRSFQFSCFQTTIL